MTQSRIKQLKNLKDSPEYDAVKDIANDADNYHALKTVLDMQGGKALVDALIATAVSNVNRFTANYAELTRDDMVAIAATIEVNLEMARTLTRASENLENADEALAEALRA